MVLWRRLNRVESLDSNAMKPLEIAVTAHAHPHQHSVKVVSSGTNVEQALSHALAGLADPDGHYTHLVFQSFEVLRIAGTFGPDGRPSVQLTVEAYASHKE